MGTLDPRREPAWRRYLRFWGTDPARDLDDELEFHLAALYDLYVAEGMSPADARAESRRRFGNLSRVRDECVTIDSQWNRERSVSDKMRQLVGELRHALHQLLRNPSLSVAAIICLALGIGANTAIFSVVNAVLYRPLDFRDPDELVLVGEELPRFSDTNLGVISLPELTDYARLDGRIFARSAAYEPADYAIAAAGADPERVTALRASTTLLEVLGVNPARGRSFLSSDADTASESVAIISDALSLLFGVSPFDATSFLVSVAVLFVCAVAAAYNPARRASRIDPQVALRAE